MLKDSENPFFVLEPSALDVNLHDPEGKMFLHTPTVCDLWGEWNRRSVWGDSALSQAVNQQELTDLWEKVAVGGGGGVLITRHIIKREENSPANVLRPKGKDMMMVLKPVKVTCNLGYTFQHSSLMH